MEELTKALTDLTTCLAIFTGFCIGFLIVYIIKKLLEWTEDYDNKQKQLKKSQEDDIAFLARNEAFKACYEYLKDKKNEQKKQ